MHRYIWKTSSIFLQYFEFRNDRRYVSNVRGKQIKFLISLSYFEDFLYFTYRTPFRNIWKEHGQSVVFLSAIVFKDTYRPLSACASLVEILS